MTMARRATATPWPRRVIYPPAEVQTPAEIKAEREREQARRDRRQLDWVSQSDKEIGERT